LRSYEIIPSLLKTLKKILKKDKSLYTQTMTKISEIISTDDIERYKNLRHDLKESKRVHVRHFVLVFDYKKKENKIIFRDFDHHDKIYTK